MDLSIKDLIFKPETAGPGILRPSAQGVSAVASLAAFNNLLGQVSQIQRNTADRPPERYLSPTSVESQRAAHSDNDQMRTSPSREKDTANRSSTDDGRTSPAEISKQVSPTGQEAKAATPSANPENDAPDAAALDTPTYEVSGIKANATPAKSAAFSIEQLNTVAMAAVTAAHAIQGGPGDTAPGQDVATTVASATTNRASALTSAATPTALLKTDKALGAKSIVESAGTNNVAKTKSIGVVTIKGVAPVQAAVVFPGVKLPAEVTLQKSPVFAQPRSPLAPGIFAAQEVAGSQAAVFQFQTGNSEPGSVLKPGAIIPSGGTHVTPQMAGTLQTGINTLPSPANTAFIESNLGSNTSTATILGPPTSGIFGVGANATSATGPGASSASTAAMRSPPPLSVPADQFAVHIARAAAGGADHISIRLKPASLGQVEVKLEVTHDGRIAAVVTAERSETLDMLQRDARALERALQDAGLKTDSNSLQFNLRGKNGSGQEFNDMNTPAPAAQGADVGNVVETPGKLVAGVYQNLRASVGGVDISV